MITSKNQGFASDIRPGELRLSLAGLMSWCWLKWHLNKLPITNYQLLPPSLPPWLSFMTLVICTKVTISSNSIAIRMAPCLISWALGQIYVSFISGSLLDGWSIESSSLTPPGSLIPGSLDRSRSRSLRHSAAREERRAPAVVHSPYLAFSGLSMLWY